MQVCTVFAGRDSGVVDVYPMSSPSEFVSTLEDDIRKRGAMDKLISDNANEEISKRVLDILRALVIEDWQSEPHYQHQNFAERRYQDVKRKSNWLLNFTGATPDLWLLAIQYVCFVTNHTAHESLKWRTPLEVLTGVTPDISPITQFVLTNLCTPIGTRCKGRSSLANPPRYSLFLLEFAENVGHSLTYKVLTIDTRKILYRSSIRCATLDKNVNRRLTPIYSRNRKNHRKRILPNSSCRKTN